MSAETTIVCDGCARIVTAAKTKTMARDELRANGGATLGDRDYCAECLRLRGDRGGIVERDLESHLGRAHGGLSAAHAHELALTMLALAKGRQRAVAAANGAKAHA
jgi:hypothetical protein